MIKLKQLITEIKIESLLREFVNNGVYIFDADNIGSSETGKNIKLGNQIRNKILNSGKKISLLVAPAGAGKSTISKDMGQQFVSSEEDIDNAESFLLLAGSAMTKSGDISTNLMKQVEAVKKSGGDLMYLYVPNLEIKNRKANRAFDVGSDDYRTEKSLKGTHFAPLNQYEFINKLKDIGFKIIKSKEQND